MKRVAGSDVGRSSAKRLRLDDALCDALRALGDLCVEEWAEYSYGGPGVYASALFGICDAIRVLAELGVAHREARRTGTTDDFSSAGTAQS